MIQDDIETVREGAVLVVKFARPAKKNALTVAMYRRVTQAFNEAAQDSAIKAVVLGTQSDIFTAGNDLKDFMEHGATSEGSDVLGFLKALTTFEKPLVAAVDGKAIGVGFTLLLHCDLVFASPRASLVAPFVDLGLVPEAASSWLLPRRIGHARAAQMLMLGEAVDAQRALSWGLFNEIVPAEEVFARGLQAAQKLSQKPPEALRLTKMLMKEADTASVKERVSREAAIFTERLASPETAEAIMAFFEKRKPDSKL